MYIDKIKQWGEDYCKENELFLVRVEQNGNKIEVYADGLENITISQCGKLSRHLQSMLEEETEILNNYSFDVSSPGLSNPLILPFQYKKRLGKSLDVETLDGIAVSGEVKEADDEGISLLELIPKNKKKKIEEKIVEHKIKYSNIKKAIIPIPTKFKKK